MSLTTRTTRFPPLWQARFSAFGGRRFLRWSCIFFVVRPLRSPRAIVVINGCSREHCYRFCRNRQLRRSIARVRKLGLASSRALFFGYALPYVGRKLRPPPPKSLQACYYAPQRFFVVFNRPGRRATAPSFEFQAIFFCMFCDERGSSGLLSLTWAVG